ncbi:MAG TPA: hypothetical protein EYQ83_05360 [Acidobacteria bacterium]|nr:hypothetical protein [Acidobacteriota bacterium]
MTAALLTPHTWTRIAVAQVLLFGALVAYWYYQIEFNYVNTVDFLDQSGRLSWAQMADGVLSGTTEFRPGQAFAVKLVSDLFGPSRLVFATLELGMLLLVAWLFFRLLLPRSEATWFGFTVGFCCLFGLHTTRDVFVTALPLGHANLVVTILLLSSLVLLRHGPSVGVDVSAFLLSLVAIFHIEAGVIVPAVWLVAGAVHRTRVVVPCVQRDCDAADGAIVRAESRGVLRGRRPRQRHAGQGLAAPQLVDVGGINGADRLGGHRLVAHPERGRTDDDSARCRGAGI